MENQLKRDRDWQLAVWEDQRKDREQFHKHVMSGLHFLFILILLTATLIAFIFKSEDTRLTTVVTVLVSWISATVFERHRHGIQPLQRKKILNEQQKKLD